MSNDGEIWEFKLRNDSRAEIEYKSRTERQSDETDVQIWSRACNVIITHIHRNRDKNGDKNRAVRK